MILSRLTDSSIVRFTQKVFYNDVLQALRPSIILDYHYISGEFSELKERRVEPAIGKRYAKPVVFLTSNFCFSACDTFVSAAKENKLAIIIGESTSGGTGNPMVFNLPFSEHKFRYSVAQGFKAISGEYIEGIGTAPDIILEPTVQERVAGTDVQLEKTAKYLAEKIGVKFNNESNKKLLPMKLFQPQATSIQFPYDIEADMEVRRSKD